jgi:ribonuclease Z
MLDLALVGTGGMLPLPNRWLSSVLLRYQGRLVLFDCGEGTQISLRALGWGLKDIDLILISHLHGDHVSGLPGLLLSQGNAGRTEPLEILGPPGLGDAVSRLRVIAPYLPFQVRCRDLAAGETFRLGNLRGASLPTDHSVPCLAYRLEVPRQARFLPERAHELGVPREQWKALQRGKPVSVDGRTVRPDEVLGPPRRGLAVGLVTDTRPVAALADFVADVDLLVCEGTYGNSDDQPRAVERKHMTFAEAAELARRAHARQLLLTHFSPALVDPEAYAPCARTIFPNTVVGKDHLALSLRFPEEAGGFDA